MFKFQCNALLFGVIALCCLFACTKATEPITTTPTLPDHRPTIALNVNGENSDFKVGVIVLDRGSNSFFLSFDYVINPGPNFLVSASYIPNKIGTHEITNDSYPSFKTYGNIFIYDDDLIETYYVFENIDNNITILSNDTAKHKITGNLKWTFVRENNFPKKHSYPDTLVIEKSGLELPYKVN